MARFECGGVFGLVRIMLDCCAQSEVLADSFVNRYSLQTYKTASVITGIGGQVNSSCFCSLKLKSQVSSFEITVEADVVPSSSIKYALPASRAYISREALNIGKPLL